MSTPATVPARTRRARRELAPEDVWLPDGFDEPARPEGPAPAADAFPAPGERRTIVITGKAQAARAHRPLDGSRRRPPRTLHDRTGGRPDRIALWAFLLGLVLVLVAATSSHAATPTARAAGAHAAYQRVDLGSRVIHRGLAGRDVRTLQHLLGVSADGLFGKLTGRAVRAFQRDAGLAADGRVGPMTKEALVSRRMSPRIATWYGPGLYGNRTACGLTLTKSLRGVAHRKLPCGAVVTLYYGGRFTTAHVVDRGPYSGGATFDLTAATARALGLTSTSQVRAAY